MGISATTAQPTGRTVPSAKDIKRATTTLSSTSTATSSSSSNSPTPTFVPSTSDSSTLSDPTTLSRSSDVGTSSSGSTTGVDTSSSASSSTASSTSSAGTTTTRAKSTTLPESTTTTRAKTTSLPESTTTPFQYSECRTELNVRFANGSVLWSGRTSVDDCCRRCQVQPGCLGFIYDVKRKTCHLLNATGERSVERKWLSGGVEGSAVFDAKDSSGDDSGKCLDQQYAMSYYGGNLGIYNNVSQGDCCELCYERLDCVGYSFEKGVNASSSGDCTLKRKTKQKQAFYGDRLVSATLTAKRNLSTTAGPTPTVAQTTKPTTTAAPRPKEAPPEPKPPVLDETEQVVVDTIQSIGCIWIVVAASLTLAVCALFRNTSHERLIHVSQELSILMAHAIILAHRDPKASDYNWTLCRLSAMALHYLQTVTTAAFLLEAVQIYAVSTSVELAGGFFTRRASFVLAWALPAVLTGMTAPFIYYSYVSWFSCWINLDAIGSKVVFGPIMILVAITVITWEAASSFRGEVLASDPTQRLTALVNRQGLPVVMGLYVACHATGSMAIHYQQVGIYGLVFVLNAVFGSCLFFFHALSDQRIRAAFAKILPCLKTN